MTSNFLRRGAGALAGSPLFRRGKHLYSKNSSDWNLSLSKYDKLLAGAWLILEDYSNGIFPPKFLDQEKAYQAEKNFRYALPGVNVADINSSEKTKPFWQGKLGRHFFNDFNTLAACLEKLQIIPPARLLELGCGNGWLSEFLATMGFEVCGTTISEPDVADANLRIKSLEIKGLSPKLSFLVAPMESVHTAVPEGSFDAVFVYEALHHAFDWHQTLQSSFQCLKKGGWMIICAEPNVLHTFISYRVAKLSRAHEIGFKKGELVAQFRKVGFQKIISAGPKLHFWVRPHWLLAQK